jgi:hypothetical protein
VPLQIRKIHTQLNKLIQCGRTFLQKLGKKPCGFDGTQRFNLHGHTVRHLSHLRSILAFSSHLHLGLLFPSGFRTNNMCHIPFPTLPSWSDHPNTWWGTQIMKLLITILSIPASLPTSSVQTSSSVLYLERLRRTFFLYSNTPPETSSNRLYPTTNSLSLTLERRILVCRRITV